MSDHRTDAAGESLESLREAAMRVEPQNGFGAISATPILSESGESYAWRVTMSTSMVSPIWHSLMFKSRKDASRAVLFSGHAEIYEVFRPVNLTLIGSRPEDIMIKREDIEDLMNRGALEYLLGYSANTPSMREERGRFVLSYFDKIYGSRIAISIPMSSTGEGYAGLASMFFMLTR